MTLFEASKLISDKYREKYQDDEDGFSNFFLNCISDHRIKAFRYSQQREHYAGADWLWLVLSPRGVYIFLVQAKKIHEYLKKSQVLYNDGKQLAALLRYSKRIAAFPIYVLFSDRIRKVNCNSVNVQITEEHVFFEPAQTIKKWLQRTKYFPPNYKPISCLFSCYQRKCYYKRTEKNIQNHGGLCFACAKCRKCATLQSASNCWIPFERFIREVYDLPIKAHPLQPELFLFSYAESIFLWNQKLLNDAVETYLGSGPVPVRNIIVSDYIGRHDDYLTKAIMGKCFETDKSTVLSQREIISVLTEQWMSVADLIHRIGIFGSYARLFAKEGLTRPVDPADEVDKPCETKRHQTLANAASDVDIAIEYNVEAFKSNEDVSRLYRFIRGIIGCLHKNIDFVDYLGVQGDKEFVQSIDLDMIWVARSWEKNLH